MTDRVLESLRRFALGFLLIVGCLGLGVVGPWAFLLWLSAGASWGKVCMVLYMFGFCGGAALAIASWAATQ